MTVQPMLPFEEEPKKPETKKAIKKPAPAKQPATELMKIVAAKAPRKSEIKKTFTDREITEIEKIIEKKQGSDVAQKEKRKEQYRKIKRRAKEMEAENRSKLIVFPSLSGDDDRWYKLADTSALYYAYRLADRMGRKAKVVRDTDNFSKCLHIASLTNMEKFIEEFKNFEGGEPEITAEGIYIFPLKKELTDDDIGQLRRTEETRREKLHNLVKPQAMEPEIFQGILTLVRQVAPKARALEKFYYMTIGEQMLDDLVSLEAYYSMYADGVYDKATAGRALVITLNRISAGLIMLAELRIWEYDATLVIGANLAELKQLIMKRLGVKKTNES